MALAETTRQFLQYLQKKLSPSNLKLLKKSLVTSDTNPKHRCVSPRSTVPKYERLVPLLQSTTKQDEVHKAGKCSRGEASSY